MKEEERIKFVEGLNIVLEYYDLFQEKSKQLLDLTGDENIEKYLELKKELDELKLYGTFASREKLINEFWNYAKMDFAECKHEIWYYCGSYMIRYNEGRPYEFKCDDETHKNFSYNKYHCLECGKTRCEENWKKFEQEHIVLKAKENVPYELEFVNLLIEHPVKETQKILINKHNK